jgi:DNA mismatch endonuclease (patch repair protein)
MRINRVSADVSRRMRAVSRQDTAAEIELQKTLRREHVGFETHVQILGCRPDVVLRSSRIAVFVDGDFWHGRLLVECGMRALRRSFRKECQAFWVAKIVRNAARDRTQTCRLRRHGWCVIRVWEREILKDPVAAALIVVNRAVERRQSLRRLGGS